MKKLTLKVKTREATGRGPMRRLRNTGYLPGVVYGESGTRHLQIKQTDFLPLLKQTLTSTAFVELQDEEGTCILSLIQEVQRNASTDQFYHIDFREITRGRPLNASVALHIVGEAVGVTTQNGILEVHMHEIEVRCRPRHMPEFIQADVSTLQVGESLHRKDLAVPEAVELPGDPEDLIATCTQPRLSIEAEAATVVESGEQ